MRPGGRFQGWELPLRVDRKLRLRTAVCVVHQLVRGVSLATCFGRIRLPLRGMQISVRFRRACMANGLMERTPTRNHRLNGKT